MNKSTYGELLFERYLTSQNVTFEREPTLPGITQLIDFVVPHSTHGKILLEVKDVENEPPARGGAFDPYKPIRAKIAEGTRKFKSTADYVCALVIVAAPGSFVDLQSPMIVLGAMYGNYGFSIPFNPELGHLDRTQMKDEFIVGEGKMVLKSGYRNTRIAALITLHEFKLWYFAMRKYMNTEDGRTRGERAKDIFDGLAQLPPENETATGVTVWENGAAAKKLPRDLFHGSMDAWWELTGEHQSLTFVGEARREFGIDEKR